MYTLPVIAKIYFFIKLTSMLQINACVMGTIRIVCQFTVLNKKELHKR